MNIMHRDIKSENIMLASPISRIDENASFKESLDQLEKLNVKVLDFGFASFYNPKKGVSDRVGTPLYIAPEILLKMSYSTKCDIWSLGILVYVLLTGCMPYSEKRREQLYKVIK
jgi:calcium-dependent protein kinase